MDFAADLGLSYPYPFVIGKKILMPMKGLLQ